MRPASLVLVLAALAACGPSRAFLKEARSATEANDWERSYRAYDRVLDRKPAHLEALSGRGDAQRRILDVVDAELEVALANRQFDRADQALSLAARVDAPAEWVRPRRERWEQAWLQVLEAERATARQRGALGDAFAYAWGMEALTGSPTHAEVRASAWSELRAEELRSLSVAVRGPSQQRFSERLQAAWLESSWGQVPLTSRGDGDLRVEVRVASDACRDEIVGQRRATHDYKDGTFVRNPRIRELQAQLSEAGRGWDAAEAQRRDRQRQEDASYGALEEVRRGVERLVPVLQRADRELAQLAADKERLAAQVGRSEAAGARLIELQQERQRRRGELDRLDQEQQAAANAHREASLRMQRVQPRLQALETQLRAAKQAKRQAEEADVAAQSSKAAAEAALTAARERLEERELEPPGKEERFDPVPELEGRVEETVEERDRRKSRVENAKASMTAADATGDAAAITAAKTQLRSARSALRETREALEVLRNDLAKARFRQSRRRARKAARQAEAAAATLQQHLAVLQELRPRTQEVRERRDALSGRLAELDRSLVAIEGRQNELREQGRQARADREALTPVAQQLETRKRAFRDVARSLRLAVSTFDGLRRQMDRLAAVQADREAEHEAARQMRLQAEGIVREWSERGASLQAALDAEPDQVELLKHADYVVTRHRRTCTVAGEMRITSPRVGARTAPFTAEHVSEDDTHPADRRIRLPADALELDGPPPVVLDRLRAAAVAEVHATVGGQLADEASLRRRQARSDRDGQTRDRVVAEFLAPSGDVEAYLRANYTLPTRR